MAEKTRTKFTPGPWVVEKDGSHVFVMGPEGWVVTEAFYLGLDVAKANAALPSGEFSRGARAFRAQ